MEEAYGLHEVFCVFDDPSRSIICYDMGNDAKLVKETLAQVGLNSVMVEIQLAQLSKPALEQIASKKLEKLGASAFASAGPFDIR